MVGPTVSTVKDGTFSVPLAFPAESETRTVQLVYVPSDSDENVMVLLPMVALVVALEHEPPYVIVPASVEEKT